MINHDYNFSKIKEYKHKILEENSLSSYSNSINDIENNASSKEDFLPQSALKEAIYNIKNIAELNACPYCGCSNFIKFGKYQSIQRYRCKNPHCKKTFSNTTNSMWKYTKFESEKWLQYIELMLEDRTLKNIASELGISVSTSFYWRHKLLHALEENYKPNKLKDVVHIKTCLKESCFKGSHTKNFTPEEKRNIRLNKIRGNKVRNIDIIFSKDNDDIPLIVAAMPQDNVTELFENNILPILDSNCYVHPDGYNSRALIKCIVNHDKTIPRKKKVEFNMHVKHIYSLVELEDNLRNDETIQTFILYLNIWQGKFRGIASKYINHYYNFYSLIQSKIIFNPLDIFFNLLKCAKYNSINMLKATHVENY